MSRQIHPSPYWNTPYLEMRRLNWLGNRRRVMGGRRLYELVGDGFGREAYIIFAGPSVVRNLVEVEIPSDAVVIGVNRGAVHYEEVCGRSVDLMILADGSITPGMCVRLWGRVPAAKSFVACAWVNPGMVEGVSDSELFWMRPSGLGHEMAYTGIPVDLDELEYSFNTGTMGLHLADLLGCLRINLIGADFALTDRMFHKGELAEYKDHLEVIAVPDVDGGITVARMDQFIAARKMETWAYILKQYGVEVRNLTGRGGLKRWMT